MWRKILAIFLGSLIVIMIVTAMYLKSQSFMTTAVNTLSVEAATFLGTRVAVGDLNLNGIQSIRMDDVAVYDKAGERLFSADRVEVAFDVLSILSGRSISECIDVVEIERPDIYIYKRNDGVWNYNDLISENRDDQSVFYGKVKLQEGSVNIGLDGKKIPIEQVTAMFDFSAQPAIAFSADFKQNSGVAKVSGSSGGKTLSGSVKAETFNFADYLDLLPPEMAFKLRGGTLKSVDVTFLKDPSGYRIDGEAIVLGVDLQVADMVVNDVDGLILFDEKHLRLFSRGRIKEEPIVLRGKVSLDVVEPVLDLQVSSTKFDLNKIIDQAPLKGAVSFKANIYGKYKDPTIDAVIRMKDAELYDFRFNDLETKISYSGDNVIVESLQATVGGGSFSGSGIVNIEAEDYKFKVKADQVPLSVLTGESYPLKGLFSADLALAGKGNDINKALVYGNAQLVKGSYKDIGLDKLAVNIYKENDNMVFDAISLTLPQGDIVGKGEIKGEKLAFDFQGSQIGLDELQKLDDIIQLTGKADFSGTARGTLNNPEIIVAIEAQDGEVYKQPYSRVQADITFKDQRLLVDKLLLINGEQQHRATGFVELQGDKRLDFSIDSTAVRVENLIKLMGEEDITGNVNNAMRVTGTMADVVVRGKLDFYEGSMYDIVVEKISGDYMWENDCLILDNFVLSSPNIDVNLNGVVRSKSELDFSIEANGVDFGKIRLDLPYPVAGEASFAGRVAGTVKSPTFKGELTANKLSFNESDLEDIKGEVIYKNDKIQLTSIAFRQNQGEFKLSGDFALDSDEINGELSVDHGDLADILAVANVKNGWIDGALDGEVILSGTIQAPYMRLSGLVSEGNLRGYPLNNLSIDLTADTDVVNLKTFRAEQKDSLLVGQGRIVFDGETDLEFSGKDIDAALLTHLLGYDVPAKGILNFGAKVTGKTDNPKAELSFDIQGGGVGTASFDSLYGLFRLENGIVQVEQLLAKKDNYKASAYGLIPLKALANTAEASEDLKNQMDLRISLDQADLTILPFLTKEVEWAVGKTTGRIDVRGSLGKPLVYGKVAVNAGALKFKALGKPLQNFEFDMEFLGDKLKLERFEGVMGKGSYKMTGEANITEKGINKYSFVLDLNNLEINNKYYTGPLEGQLLLEEGLVRGQNVPKLSGDLKFANCIFDIPPIPESEDQIPLVKLDLNIKLGKKVRLYNSFLYDILLEGNANFSGNTRRPQSSGEISAVRGKLYYLKTPFQIREASAYFNQVNSFLPSLQVEADTRLQQTRVYMQVSGSANKMKIRLTSSPEMNETEILSLLTLRSRYYSGEGTGLGKEDFKALFGIGLQMSFISEAENLMRNALGLDEFKVVRDTLSNRNTKGTDEVYNLEIGKYINDKIMLRYVGGIDHTSYKYGVRYEFDNRISMTSNLNKENEASFSVEARFKF